MENVYLWASLLLVANLAAWLGNVFNLPGNWIMLTLAALYAWFLPPELVPRISWWVVGTALLLAIAGELLETFAGAAGAAKHGGSRRGVVLAIIGAFIGSLLGATISIPIFLIGPIIGALGGGALGAFAGAWLGELGTERTPEERLAIGRGAMVGRMLGTVGKLGVGAIILALVSVDSFLDMKSLP